MSIRSATLLAIVFSWTIGGALLAVGAHAGSASVTIDGTKSKLATASDGTWTTALGFTNLTTDTLVLAVTPATTTDTGCMPTIEPGDLAPATHTDVSVTLNAGCTVSTNGITLQVNATAPGGTSPAASFTVSAAPEPMKGIDWNPLRAFPIAFLSLLSAGGIFYGTWKRTDQHKHHRLTEPLKYLDATWSFKDSWVSNITVGAALLTGVFGSADVVTAMLGTNANDAVALATVGAAIGAAFVAAGPILLASTNKGGVNTVGGLLAASVLTLTGAAGEIYTVYASARLLDLGGGQHYVYLAAIFAGALLALYAVRSLHAVLEQGTTKPPQAPPSDAIVAAKMVVAVLKAKADIDDTELARNLAPIEERHPQIVAEPIDTRAPQRRRSALL